MAGSKLRAVIFLLVLPGLALAGEADAQLDLLDVTSETGIAFEHTDGDSGNYYIIEYVSAGLALFDYDGDGHEDIYFLNGAPQPGSGREKKGAGNALYRNNGDWTFTDVTEKAGVGDTGHGLGVVAGDYDNDGDLDLYLNNHGPNVLYQNNGDGTFKDVTALAGVANGHRVGAGACFLDIEGDGDLDLYVSNYIKFSYDKHEKRTRMGYPIFPSPRDYQPDPDTLYRNNGNGTFTDISVESGIAAHAGPGMGMICADVDGDGDTDIFVGNDVEANFLFVNDGKGKFEEGALMAGLAFDLHGHEHGSMGVACGDYNNDGLLDFFVTSYQHELATLYKNGGDGFFEDATLVSRAGAGTLHNVTWGNGLVDFDNDGHRDIFVACGHLNPFVDKYDDSTRYRAENLLLLNDRRGRFKRVVGGEGSGLRARLSSRGAAFGDLDNDGDMDAVILNSRARPTILKNDCRTGHHWIAVNLAGKKANRFGVGALVTVTAGGLKQVAEVHSGRGYQGHYGLRLHFGLGENDKVDAIQVKWPGGGEDIVRQVKADRIITIEEGSGTAR